MIDYSDFEKVEIRVGTVLEAKIFDKAKNPAYILHIDFGEKGILKSSAQITDHYAPEALVGRQVVAVVNFPPRQIANIQSQCLVLGAVGESGVVLLQPERAVDNGLRIL
ncbi:MAG: tRNA-binding protein [Cryomorphaceae bacterium]|nr:tRNA-binding protein [Cryomorphaceae bacterium]